MSIGCEPALIALLKHQLTFFEFPRCSFALGCFFPLVYASRLISCSNWQQTFKKLEYDIASDIRGLRESIQVTEN